MTTPTIYFHNPGELDIRAATLLGVNVKTKPSAFGHFGTGLKYAIAGVCRLGGQIELWDGQCMHWFTAEPEMIREREFQVIYHHTEHCKERMGFTTELGKDWEPWMLYRELLSNALDEGGKATAELVKPFPGHTVIGVTCPELWQAHQSRSDFWLEPASRKLVWANDRLEVYEGASDAVFYRGIRATAHTQSAEAKGWAFTYNILAEVTLTEDRTFASDWDMRTQIAYGLCEADEKEMLKAVFGSAGRELELDFDQYSVQYSNQFVAVALAEAGSHHKLPKTVRDYLERTKKKELEEAEAEPLGESFAEMLAKAPEAPEKVSTAGFWTWQTAMEERMKKLEAQAAYWQRCAEALAKRGEADGS